MSNIPNAARSNSCEGSTGNTFRLPGDSSTVAHTQAKSLDPGFSLSVVNAMHLCGLCMYF